MLNMIKLDWNAIKYYHKRLLIVPLGLMVVGWFSPIHLVPMSVFLLFSFSLNPFAVEEKGDLNRLYLTLPLKRSRIVAGRYTLSFFLTLSGILLALALMPLANLISSSKWYPDLKWTLALASFAFLLYAIMSLFMYPVLFWMGYQRGKFWGFYLPMSLFTVAFLVFMECDILYKNGRLIFEMLVFASEHIALVSGGMFLLGAVLLAVSYLLSTKIYSRREF